MSGGRKQAKPACARPFDGRVRRTVFACPEAVLPKTCALVVDAVHVFLGVEGYVRLARGPRAKLTRRAECMRLLQRLAGASAAQRTILS